MDKMRTIPSIVLNKLAADVDRNRRIVDSVAVAPRRLDDAALRHFGGQRHGLGGAAQSRGVPAVAIAGTTDPAARRYYIEEFKAGPDPRDHQLQRLTQGFDAPAVQAVYVTRPTFSPNVYQQMIGRGLRGPLNGGSEEVLIVNVEDNFQQFGDRLAFLEFEHLWNPDLAAEDRLNRRCSTRSRPSAASSRRPRTARSCSRRPEAARPRWSRRFSSTLSTQGLDSFDEVLAISFSRAAVGALERRSAAQRWPVRRLSGPWTRSRPASWTTSTTRTGGTCPSTNGSRERRS